jgi:hypothetical protein
MALLGVLSFTTAVTDYAPEGAVSPDLGSPFGFSYTIRFSPTGDGTTCAVILDTTVDEGQTWIDIARLDFTTTAALGIGTNTTLANVPPAVLTALTTGQTRPFLGNRIRARVTTTGTYSAGSNVRIDYFTRSN